MRNSRGAGLGGLIGAAFAIAALHGAAPKRAKTATKRPRELTEVEKWNAEVEAKKAAKKARRASGEKQG